MIWVDLIVRALLAIAALVLIPAGVCLALEEWRSNREHL